MAGNLSKAKMSAKPDVAESSSKRQHGMSDNKSKDIVQSKTQQKPRNFAKQIEFFDDDVNFDPYNQDDNPTGQPFDLNDWSNLKPSRIPSANEYAGGQFRLGQPTNLITPTYYNQGYLPSSAGGDVSKVLTPNSQAHQLMNVPSQRALQLEGSRKMAQSSESERQAQPFTFQIIDKSGVTMPTTSQHQTSTFQELARKQGLREWDHDKVDNRWALRPEETWNIRSRTLSNMMANRDNSSLGAEKTTPQKSSEEQAKIFAEKLEQLNNDLKETQIKVQAMQHKEYEAGAGSTSADATVAAHPGPTRAEAMATNEAVIREAPEPRLLRRYITDLILGNGTGRLPRGLPYEPDFIRRQFYKVVFGTMQPPSLSPSEERELVKKNKEVMTYGQLRKSIFVEIDFAVEIMTRPLSRGSHDSSKANSDTQGGGEKAPGRASDTGSTTIPGSTNAHLDTRPSTALTSSEHHQANAPEESSQSPSKPGGDMQDRSSPEGKGKGKMPSRSETQPDDQFHFSESPSQLNEEKKDDLSPQGKGQCNTPPAHHQVQQHDEFASSHTLPPAATQGPYNLTTSTPVTQGHPTSVAPGQHYQGSASFPPPTNSQYGTSSNSVTQGYPANIAPSQPYQGPTSFSPSTNTLYGTSATPVPQGHPANVALGQPYQGPTSFSPPTNAMHGTSSMPQPWLFQAQQYNSFQAYGGVMPNQSGFTTPHYPYPQHGTGYNSRPYSSVYNDRPTRPPARNRLAPLYANSPAFRPQEPAPQPRTEPQPRTDNVGNQVEWQARRGTPHSASSGGKSSVVLPFRSGADDMYPRPHRGTSTRLQNLIKSEPLQASIAMDESNVPFGETALMSKPAEWGVLRITNMPYDITPASIITFLGSHAKIITPDLGPAVHIIMDRSTGKTQDAFVEFFSPLDAKAWVSLIRSRPAQMNKIGDRILEVELSNQEELLKEIFPRARSIIWRGGADGKQVVAQESEDPFDSGFKGFITMEEVQSLVRHAEQPHRSIYTQKCPPRPYTGLISVLTKFPWYATELYTLATRNILFTATMAMIRHLVGVLHQSGRMAAANPYNQRTFPHHGYSNISSPVAGISSRTFQHGPHSLTHYPGQQHMHGLNDSLLRDLVMAGLNAYGFSDKQRWEIHQTAAPFLGREMFRLSDLARGWPFETLGRKRGMEEDVVEVYARLMSSHPTVFKGTQTALLRVPSLILPFGSLETFYELLDLNTTTMDQMAQHEQRLLATLITEVCNRNAGQPAEPRPASREE